MLCIGSVDVLTTKSRFKSYNRKMSSLAVIAREKQAASTHSEPLTSTEAEREDISDESNGSDFYFDAGDSLDQDNSYCNLELPSVASMCDRTGSSNRAAAAIASAVLHDLRIVTNEAYDKVVDKNKVHRARSKQRNLLASEPLQDDNPIAQYFDGRKDTILSQEEKIGKKVKCEIVEEHVTILTEPGSHYLCHVVPSSGKANDIGDHIIGGYWVF